MTFFCWAVEIPKKSVEQLRFEQLHFKQLTLTLAKIYEKMYVEIVKFFKMIVIAKLSSFVLRRFWPTDKAKLLASTLAVQTFTTERCSSQNRQTIKRFIWNMKMEVFFITFCSNNAIKYLISNALYNKNDKSLWMTAVTENQRCFLRHKLQFENLRNTHNYMLMNTTL